MPVIVNSIQEMVSPRSVREKRNALLAETDYWCLNDHATTQEQLDYRQALRDIPQQSGFPNVTWPTKPE